MPALPSTSTTPPPTTPLRTPTSTQAVLDKICEVRGVILQMDGAHTTPHERRGKREEVEGREIDDGLGPGTEKKYWSGGDRGGDQTGVND